MKIRTVLLVAAVAVAITGVGPATATQSAGVQRYFETSIAVHGKDGLRYTFDLLATEAGVGDGLPSQLLIDLSQCGGGGSCKQLGKARLSLPAGTVRVAPDLSTASLVATVSGVKLSATLVHAFIETAPPAFSGAGVRLYSVEAAGGGPSPRFSTYVKGAGAGGLGRLSCPIGGEISSYQGLDRTGDETRDPRPTTLKLSKQLLAALSGARC